MAFSWGVCDGLLLEPSEEPEPVLATVAHADIRELGPPYLCPSRRLLRSMGEGRLSPPRNTLEGCAETEAASPPMVRDRDHNAISPWDSLVSPRAPLD